MEAHHVKRSELSLQRMVSMLVSLIVFTLVIFPGLYALKEFLLIKLILSVLVIFHVVCGFLWFKKDLASGAHSFFAVVIYVYAFRFLF